MYNNGTLINSGNSPVSNLTAFNNTGLFNITSIYSGNANYSRASETWWVNVSIDTYPLINITTPLNNTNSSNTGLDVNYTVSDNVGVSSCWYSNDTMSINTTLTSCSNITSVIWSEGQHNVTVWANDTINNINFTSVRFTIDTTAPYFTTIPANASLNYKQELNVDFDATDSREFGTYAVNDSRFVINSSGGLKNNTILGVGTYVINVTVNDTLNNLNSTLYQVDVNQLSSSVNLTLNGTQGNITINIGSAINLNCSTISGDASARLVLYNNSNLMNNGTSPIGNTTTFSSISLENITCTYFSSQNYSQSSQSYWVNVSDIEKPSITIITPLNNTNNSDNNLDVNYTVSDNVGVSSCWYSNDTMSVNTTLVSCGNITSVVWSEGWHNITVWVNDTTNNINWKSIRFRTDTIPPLIIVYPANNTNSSNTGLNVNYTVSDSGSGIGMCWYSNDTMSVNISLGSNCANITTATWSQGQHNVIVWVNDSAGNKNSSSVSFTIDITPPVFNTTDYVTWGTNKSGSVFYMNVTWRDNLTSLDSWKIGSNQTGIWINHTNGTNWINKVGDWFIAVMNFTITAAEETSFKVDACANDSVNNWNCTYQNGAGINFSVLVAQSPPNINFTTPTPSNASTQNYTSIYVNVSSTDDNDHYTFTDFNNDLVLWMRMDDVNSSGDPWDRSVYGNNGTLEGNALINSTGKFGNASWFDGTDDYISFNSNPFQYQNMTISSWIYAKGNGSPGGQWGGIVSIAVAGGSSDAQNGSVVYYDNTDSKLKFSLGNGSWQTAQSSSAINLNQWYHVVGVANGSTIILYLNGQQNGTTAIYNIIKYDGTSVRIGHNTKGVMGSTGFNGSIDEVLIFNRALSNQEILALYNASANKYYKNFTGLSEKTHNFTAYAVDKFGNLNSTEQRFVTISITTNNAPTDPVNVGINSTNGNNKTLQDLNCYANIFDPNNDKLNVTLRWYKNNSINLTLDYNNSYANGTFFIGTLDDANTTKGENWSCSLRLFDGINYSNWVNSSAPANLTILNTVPTATLIAPANANQTTDRTPNFNWTGSDDDNDTLTYEINISLVAGSLCSEADRYVNKDSLGSNLNYTPSNYLKCLWDNLDNYTWTVRAYDGQSFGVWNASARYILISSDVSVSLPVSSVNFGTMNISASENTSDGNPAPIVLQNNGNAYLNVSVNFTSLWSSVNLPNETFRFKIRNVSAGCFNYGNSTTSWTNSPLITASVINRLNFTAGYQTGCNNASVDLFVQVPVNEVAGSKSSIINFISQLGETY